MHFENCRTQRVQPRATTTALNGQLSTLNARETVDHRPGVESWRLIQSLVAGAIRYVSPGCLERRAGSSSPSSYRTSVWRRLLGRALDRTHGATDAVAGRTARALRDAGVGPGVPVHVSLRNCPELVALWLAVARLGAWLVPVDPAPTARDVSNQVHRVRPAGVCAAERAAVYRDGVTGAVPVVVELVEAASDVAPAGPLDYGKEVGSVNEIDPMDRSLAQ